MNNNNTENKEKAKLYNPKANAPAVYIPCWLIQIPSSQLSHQAKLVYGRLAQWSSAKGTVHRSTNQLSQELGMQQRVIERSLKELREKGLIETYQAELGGVNHYRFLEHDWMSEPINKNLEYNASYTPPDKNVGTPPTKMSVPTDKNVGAKIKEIKRNKITTTTTITHEEKPKSSSFPIINKEVDAILLQDRQKYLPGDDFERTDEEFLRQCSHHLDNADKDKYTFAQRLAGLRTIIKIGTFEIPAGYKQNKIIKSLFTPKETALICKYQHALRLQEWGGKFEDYMPDTKEVEKAMELIKKSKNHKIFLNAKGSGKIFLTGME